jgi:GT2 family glycosyltransferase
MMERMPDVGAVQPKLLQYHARDHFEYAGGAGGYLDRVGYPFTRGRLFFTLEQDRGQYDAAQDVDWATGAALLLRRSALDEVGVLDARFVMHMEEIDLCWRLWRHGYRVRVEPESHVYHIGGGSLPQGDPQKTYYNFRNGLLLLYKNLPPARWRTTFPHRLLLDGSATLRALVTGRWREAGAILRAYYDAHRMRRFYIGDRPTTPEMAHPPSYRGTLVLDYFLKGRRFFSDLPAHRFIKGTPDPSATEQPPQ